MLDWLYELHFLLQIHILIGMTTFAGGIAYMSMFSDELADRISAELNIKIRLLIMFMCAGVPATILIAAIWNLIDRIGAEHLKSYPWPVETHTPNMCDNRNQRRKS